MTVFIKFWPINVIPNYFFFSSALRCSLAFTQPLLVCQRSLPRSHSSNEREDKEPIRSVISWEAYLHAASVPVNAPAFIPTSAKNIGRLGRPYWRYLIRSRVCSKQYATAMQPDPAVVYLHSIYVKSWFIIVKIIIDWTQYSYFSAKSVTTK